MKPGVVHSTLILPITQVINRVITANLFPDIAQWSKKQWKPGSVLATDYKSCHVYIQAVVVFGIAVHFITHSPPPYSVISVSLIFPLPHCQIPTTDSERLFFKKHFIIQSLSKTVLEIYYHILIIWLFFAGHTHAMAFKNFSILRNECRFYIGITHFSGRFQHSSAIFSQIIFFTFL